MTIGTIELSLFDHVHRFNAGDEFGNTMKFFESQHGPRSALDGSVVLFHKIVQIFRLAQRDFLPLSAIRLFTAAVLAPLLSMVIFSGTSCNPIARSNKRRVAAWSRLAVSKRFKT